MNKKYLLISFFLVAILIVATTNNANSKLTAPPAGNAGDPISGIQWQPIESGATCAHSGCHAGPAQTPASGDLTLNIGTGSPPSTPLDANFCYTAGQQYNIAFLINKFATSNPYYGFQIVSLDASNAKAGTMAVANAATTFISTSTATGSRQFMGHHNASSTHSWSFKWTAPSTGTGQVTFYYAYNIANASVVPPTAAQGTIYHGSVTINECTSGIEDISTKISALNIFPNPISNEFSLSFDLKEAETVSTQLYSLDGKQVNEMLNEKVSEGNFVRSCNTNDLPAGVYLMKLTVGGTSITKKIVKQ